MTSTQPRKSRSTRSARVVRARPTPPLTNEKGQFTRAGLKRAGTPIGPLDTLIAAHALSLGATLVINNTSEFRRVKGLKVEDWFA